MSSLTEYTGASGGSNVFISDNTEGFIIYGINQSGFSDFFLTFGAYEAVGSFTGFDGKIFTIEYSTNATPDIAGTWNALPFAANSQTDNGWQDVKLQTNTVSNVTASNLSFRFQSTVASTQDIRIDDVSVFGITPIPEPTTAALVLCGLGLLVFRRRPV